MILNLWLFFLRSGTSPKMTFKLYVTKAGREVEALKATWALTSLLQSSFYQTICTVVTLAVHAVTMVTWVTMVMCCMFVTSYYGTRGNCGNVTASVLYTTSGWWWTSRRLGPWLVCSTLPWKPFSRNLSFNPFPVPSKMFFNEKLCLTMKIFVTSFFLSSLSLNLLK